MSISAGFVEFTDSANGESVLFHAYEEPKTAKFYAWPDRRMLNLSPVWTGPLALKAGEKLQFRLAPGGGFVVRFAK